MSVTVKDVEAFMNQYPDTKWLMYGSIVIPDAETRSKAGQVLEDDTSPEDVRAAAGLLLEHVSWVRKTYPQLDLG